MANVVRKEVEGIGISNGFEELTLCPGSYFTEIAVPEKVTIPDVKPDMEQLLSVMVDARIVSTRLINTPKGCSEEGQNLTGKKLSIELELQQKVKYVADEPTQSVHAAHFTKLVNSIWVVVPPSVKVEDCNGVEKVVCIDQLLREGKVKVTPYIEDIYAEQLDKRNIFKNITVLIHVTVKGEVGLPNPCIFHCGCCYEDGAYHDCCYIDDAYVPCDYYYHNICEADNNGCLPNPADCNTEDCSDC